MKSQKKDAHLGTRRKPIRDLTKREVNEWGRAASFGTAEGTAHQPVRSIALWQGGSREFSLRGVSRHEHGVHRHAGRREQGLLVPALEFQVRRHRRGLSAPE